MTVEIRRATEEDAPALAQIYAPYCLNTAISFEVVAPPADEMAARLHKIGQRYPWLVLVKDQAVAGYAYASAHRERAAYGWSVDTSVYVAADFHRRGVGKALYTSLLDLLPHLGYFKAYAGITLPNPGSVGLHQAVGFRPVGIYRGVGFKFGLWHDVVWLQLELQPEQPAPDPPRSVMDLLDGPEWQQAMAKGIRCLRN